MDNFGQVFGWKLAGIWLILHLLGWGYGWLVYVYAPRKKIKHRTAEFVVVGVLITIVGFGCALGWESPVLGWQAVAVLLLCFVATGLPMISGYWLTESRNEANDREGAKQLIGEMITKAKQNGGEHE